MRAILAMLLLCDRLIETIFGRTGEGFDGDSNARAKLCFFLQLSGARRTKMFPWSGRRADQFS